MLSPRGNMIRLLRYAVRVRHGTISTELGCPRHVRFTPCSDQTTDMPDRQLRAKIGHRRHLDAFVFHGAYYSFFRCAELRASMPSISS
jgi:hypothetical protein